MGRSLKVNRVVVEGELACDYSLETGLNVIQGQSVGSDERSSNKSGKTSFVYLIQYGLGKETSKQHFYFQPVGDKVSRLFLEIETDDTKITVERSMQNTSAAVNVYAGAYYDGITNNSHEKVSLDHLGDLLLSTLNIPKYSVKEQHGKLDPLSFRLLMRCFILEQRMSFNSILDRVQPDQRKADIIGFLTGVYPAERYAVEEELSSLQLETDEKHSYLSRVRLFVEQQGIPSLFASRQTISAIEQQIRELKGRQRNLRLAARASVDDATDGRLSSLRQDVVSLSGRILESQQHERGLKGDLDRLKSLRSSLNSDVKKIKRLQTSRLVLSTLNYEKCPRCLQEITSEMKAREQEGYCSLCDRPALVVADNVPRSMPRLEDVEAQITETSEIINNTEQELTSTSSNLMNLNAKLTDLERELELESNLYVSPFIDSLEQMGYEISVSEQRLAKAISDNKQAKALDSIEQEFEALKAKQANLESKLSDLRKPRLEQINRLQTEFNQVLRSVGYPSFARAYIDKADFMPTIGGSSYIHGGQAYTGLATLAYHLSLFRLAMQSECFMPKFLVIDSPAVGDMNRQTEGIMLDYIASLAQEFREFDGWQIVLTTRRCTPDLEPYVFERLSSPDRMLLQPAKAVFPSFGGLLKHN